MNCRRRKPAVTSGSYKGSGWQEAEASMELFGKGQSIAGRSKIVPAADGSLRAKAMFVGIRMKGSWGLAFAVPVICRQRMVV